jgi:hypothetical protein
MGGIEAFLGFRDLVLELSCGTVSSIEGGSAESSVR